MDSAVVSVEQSSTTITVIACKCDDSSRTANPFRLASRRYCSLYAGTMTDSVGLHLLSLRAFLCMTVARSIRGEELALATRLVVGVVLVSSKRSSFTLSVGNEKLNTGTVVFDFTQREREHKCSLASVG